MGPCHRAGDDPRAFRNDQLLPRRATATGAVASRIVMRTGTKPPATSVVAMHLEGGSSDCGAELPAVPGLVARAEAH